MGLLFLLQVMHSKTVICIFVILKLLANEQIIFRHSFLWITFNFLFWLFYIQFIFDVQNPQKLQGISFSILKMETIPLSPPPFLCQYFP